jgi:putative hydrolase of HD superfamily
MIEKELLLNLFNTTCIQRWNDKLRPIDLVELDFQAHRMMIAYFLGKWEEGNGNFSWIDLIECGIFDLLETAVLTDLKYDVKEKLNENPTWRTQKDNYVLEQLSPLLSMADNGLLVKFRTYQNQKVATTSTLAFKISQAAKIYARQCEFNILEHANPSGYEMEDIKKAMQKEWEWYNDLKGYRQLNNVSDYRNFIDLCGELRFQVRWSHLHLVPRISVLGHSMIVAVIAYLFSLEIQACKRQRINNFFTGLFHDLEESQIRDVRSPLKERIPGLRQALDEISKETMEKKVLKLIPKEWRAEFRLFAMEKLEENIVTINAKPKRLKPEEFSKYNKDDYSPRFGCLVKEADRLAAFIEAVQGIDNGCGSKELEDVRDSAPKKRTVQIDRLDFKAIYRQFDPKTAKKK